MSGDYYTYYTSADLPFSELVAIVGTMQKISHCGVLKRILSADRHAELLDEHRRRLEDAINQFQV